MALPDDDPGPRVEYRGHADVPALASSGRFILTLRADGVAHLEYRQGGLTLHWRARVESVVWSRLAAAVYAARGRGAPPPAVPTQALGILDSLVLQVSNGAVRGTPGRLPWITHQAVAEPGADTAPPSTPAAAFGTLGGRRVGGIVQPDGSVTVTGVPDGTVLARLPSSGARPRAVAFGDVDGADVIVTGGDDGLLRLWSADGTLLSTQTRHAAPVSAIAASVDEADMLLCSADRAGLVLERGLRPGERVVAWPRTQSAAFTALRWAVGDLDDLIVTGSDDGRVTVVRSVAQPDRVQVWQRHTGWVNAVAVTGGDDDLVVASAGADRVIRVRAGAAGTEWPVLAGHSESVTGVAFGFLGDRLVLGSCALDGTARTWDPRTGELLAQWPVEDWPAAIVDAAAGGVQRWATGGGDGVVRVWDAQTGAAVLTLAPDGDPSPVLAVASAPLPGLTLLAAGHQDGTLRLWDAADGRLVAVDRSSPEPFTSVEFGRDRQMEGFFCGTAAGSIRWHDPVTAALRRVLTPHTGPVRAVAVGVVDEAQLPARIGDRVLVSGGVDGTVRVWNARTGWPLHCLSGHQGSVSAVAVGQVDGRSVIASAAADGTVRTWDAASGASLLRLEGPTSAVHRVAFGAVAGRALLAAAGEDEPVRAWDAASGGTVLVTRPVGGLVSALAVGTWRGQEALVAATEEGSFRCWRLPDGELLSIEHLLEEPLAVSLSPAGELWLLAAGGATVVDLP